MWKRERRYWKYVEGGDRVQLSYHCDLAGWRVDPGENDASGVVDVGVCDPTPRRFYGRSQLSDPVAGQLPVVWVPQLSIEPQQDLGGVRGHGLGKVVRDPVIGFDESNPFDRVYECSIRLCFLASGHSASAGRQPVHEPSELGVVGEGNYGLAVRAIEHLETGLPELLWIDAGPDLDNDDEFGVDAQNLRTGLLTNTQSLDL